MEIMAVGRDWVGVGGDWNEIDGRRWQWEEIEMGMVAVRRDWVAAGGHWDGNADRGRRL